jgi:galactose-1-phosphate uridylyltransferase
MREKKLKDCPLCGATNSMKLKNNIFMKLKTNDYDEIEVGPLSGQFCEECGDGFYDAKSNRLRAKQISEGQAKQDSHRLKISDITDIEHITKITKLSKQRICQMMDEGKIPYVIIGSHSRFPVMRDTNFYLSLIKRRDAKTKTTRTKTVSHKHHA